MANAQPLKALRSPQVQVAVGEAQVLSNVVCPSVRHRKRKNVTDIVDHQVFDGNLYIHGRYFAIGRVSGTSGNGSTDFDNGFVAQRMYALQIFIGRVAYELCHSLPVPQVYEKQSSVIPDGMHPTNEPHLFTDIFCGQLIAMVRPFHLRFFDKTSRHRSFKTIIADLPIIFKKILTVKIFFFPWETCYTSCMGRTITTATTMAVLRCNVFTISNGKRR